MEATILRNESWRRFAAAVALAGLLLALLALLCVAARPASAASTDVSGPITTPTTWTQAGSPYVVTSTVVVQGGGVLTIEAGVEVRFDAGAGLRISSGPLFVLGTAAEPVTLTANSLAPTPGFWAGVSFDTYTPLTSTLDYCLIEYAATGITFGDADGHTVNHCTFRLNGDGGDWASGGAINSVGDGLFITHNDIYSNELGIRLTKAYGYLISGNEIRDNDGFGIGFIAANAPGGGNSLISGNAIYANGGFGLGFVPQGIYGGGSDNTISDNEIYDNTAANTYPGNGLHLNSGANNTLVGNYIHSNEANGVWVRAQSALTFSENIVHANGQDGAAFATTNSAPTAFHANVLCGNGQFQIDSDWAGSLPAEGNWFGTNTPASGVEIDGNVDFSPWISLTLALTPTVLPADGASAAALTVTLSSGAYAVPDGYPVTGAASEGAVAPSSLTLAGGTATAIYTAGATPGSVDFSITDLCATLTFTDWLTLEAALDLAVSKTASGLIVGPNKDYFLDYPIAVSNVGLISATHVVLTDVLPAAATYTGSDWTCAAGVCTRPLGTLVPSATLAVTLPVQLNKAALDCPIVLTNTVRVGDSSVGSDLHPADNVFTLTTVLDCLPDLVVVKNDNVGGASQGEDAWVWDLLGLPPHAPDQPQCVLPGERITYTIAYVNTGLDTATQVVLTETLPQHTSFVGAGWTPAGGSTYTRSVGSLAPSQGGVAHFAVQVVSTPPDLWVENEVRIGGAEDDLYPPDNVSADETPICEGLLLYISKDDNTPCAFPGDEIRYTIVVTNPTGETANDVVLTETLPAHTGYLTTAGWLPLGGGQFAYAVGDLAPFATATVEFVVVVDDPLPAGVTQTINVVCMSYDGPTPPNNCFTLATPLPIEPDLRVVKHDHVGPPPPLGVQRDLDRYYRHLYGQPYEPPAATELWEPVRPGDIYSYTITYLNLGRDTAHNVVLTETLPEHTTYVGYGWTPVGGGVYTYAVGDLPPGMGGERNFYVKVGAVPCNGDGYLYNWVHIAGDEPECQLNNNWSGEETPVECAGIAVYLPIILKNYQPPTPPTPPPPPPPPPPTPPPGEAYVSDVDVNPVTNRVYVASPQLDAVFAVDPSGAGSIVAQIPVGADPLGVAVVTTTNKIYAANLNSWTVTAIRGSDHTVVNELYVGAQACKLVADHGQGRVYVTNHLESDNGAAAINSQTDQFLYYYTRLHATQGRYGIALDPDAEKLFIAARDAGLIAIQDAFSPDQEPQLFKLDPPRVPFVADFNPATGHLFVTAADNNLVVVLDPYAIQWTKGRWITVRGWPVFLLDKANAGWIKEIGVGLGAEEGIAVNPQTGYVYVSNGGSDTVSILRDSANPANIGWVKDLGVGDSPQGVAVDVTRNLIYVGNAGSRSLTVIDGATHTVLKTIPLD